MYYYITTMLQNTMDHEAFKFLLQNQAYGSLIVDYQRHNANAMFQIRQRENYIEYLKNILLAKNPMNITQKDLMDNEEIVGMLEMENTFREPEESKLPPIGKKITSIHKKLFEEEMKVPFSSRRAPVQYSNRFPQIILKKNKIPPKGKIISRSTREKSLNTPDMKSEKDETDSVNSVPTKKNSKITKLSGSGSRPLLNPYMKKARKFNYVKSSPSSDQD